MWPLVIVLRFHAAYTCKFHKDKAYWKHRKHGIPGIQSSIGACYPTRLCELVAPTSRNNCAHKLKLYHISQYARYRLLDHNHSRSNVHGMLSNWESTHISMKAKCALWFKHTHVTLKRPADQAIATKHTKHARRTIARAWCRLITVYAFDLKGSAQINICLLVRCGCGGCLELWGNRN